MVLNVHRNRQAYYNMRDREKGVWSLEGGGGGGGGGGRDYIPVATHCHHQNDFCIKVGNDESHFNVS